MSIENKIRAFAGGMILLSIALTLLYSHGWLFLTGFVGINLLQSSFTKFCPLEMILKKAQETKN